MKKNYLSIILSLFFCVGTLTYTHAQVKSKEKITEKFTKEEKGKFSVVYEYTTENSFDAIKSGQKNLPASGLSEQKFGEILTAQFGGRKPTLTPTEQAAAINLNKLIEKDKQEYDKQVNKVVLAQNLTLKKYEQMKEEHLKNRFFQNEIYEIILKKGNK